MIELLVVLVILGLLVGIVVPRAIGYLSKAKSDVAKIQIENFATGLDLFRLDVGRYPSQEEGLQALLVRPTGAVTWRGPYLKASSVPLDPWDRAYVYEIPSKRGGPYDLLSASLGACKSMTMRLYADRKGWTIERIRVEVAHDKIHADDCADCEARDGKIDEFRVSIDVEGALDEDQRARLIEIAGRCPVHRTLESEIKIRTVDAL